MSKAKPTLYDQFRERVLVDIRKGDSHVWREKYVNWKEVVSKITYNKRNPYTDRLLHYTSTKKVWFDIKWRNEQLNVLHKVMDDLVKEGFLTRGDRAKPRVYHCSCYIMWYNRFKEQKENDLLQTTTTV